MAGESESFVCCGDWQLVREIGRGAYGVVYLAAGDDGSWAAVKVCRRDDVGVERYERELRGAKLYRAIPAPEADTGAKFFMAWWRILNKATDEDPRRRYQSAKALLKDMEALRREMAFMSITGLQWRIVWRIVKIIVVAAAIFLGKIVYDIRLDQFWHAASHSFHAEHYGYVLSQNLIVTKAASRDANVENSVNEARDQLSGISQKSLENSRRFNRLQEIVSGKYDKGMDVEIATWMARMIVAEEKELQHQILEIGRSVYGEKWRPSF